MRKDRRYINAGTNEVYRFGRKAQEKAAAHLEPNEKGFYNLPADGGKYWTIGTSEGKFGEFAKINGVCFSVNSWGNIYAKAGTSKAEAFIDAVNSLIEEMKALNADRLARLSYDDEEEEE
ncbi:hypothetical protein [Baileyella intestinalis]|uniref:hypothetical protein n=1 Tax=Baileyella intestinalis TaxID=2606709 RepID=UPI003A840253